MSPCYHETLIFLWRLLKVLSLFNSRLNCILVLTQLAMFKSISKNRLAWTTTSKQLEHDWICCRDLPYESYMFNYWHVAFILKLNSHQSPRTKSLRRRQWGGGQLRRDQAQVLGHAGGQPLGQQVRPFHFCRIGQELFQWSSWTGG